MTFGQTLAVLLDATGITRGQLAAHLGYDISYISRWVSDLKLPSVKNNSALFHRIADYIIKNSDESRNAAICAALDICETLSPSALEECITKALAATYGERNIKLSKNSSGTRLDNNCMLSQLDIALEENNQLIAQCIAETGYRDDITMLEFFILPQTTDFGFNESKNYLTNIEHELPADKTIHVKLAVDIYDKQYLSPICRDICVFFSGLPDRITADLYSCSSNNFNYSVFLCKDSICVLSYYDVLLRRCNSILTQNPLLLSQYFGSSDTYLRGKTSLIAKDSFVHLYEQKFFQSFSMMNESLRSLHTVMPVMFVDSQLLESIASRHNIPQEVLEIHYLYEKTFLSWPAIIYKSSVVEFLFSGNLSVFGKVIVLSREERQEYLVQFLQKTSQCDHNIAILNDINPLLNRSDIDSTLFLSKRNMFFIHPSGDEQPAVIHYSNDVRLSGNFDVFWQEINTLPPAYLMKGDVATAFLCQGLKLL